jgi:signal transduction histidine kinase
MSQEVAKSKDIALTINIPSDHFITADRNMLETVFNIISNATKFTEAKGQISVSSIANTEGVTIEIADNGIGMSEATLSTLFLQNITESKQEIIHERGLGLGLLLCKDFVERHDGKKYGRRVH